ncbi:MAG TPA: hypothetical protein VJ625_13485 [Propionibacteriaceae bacterium]|nr:hypothetical protein [Propionibacteriaceae bacterium]
MSGARGRAWRELDGLGLVLRVVDQATRSSAYCGHPRLGVPGMAYSIAVVVFADSAHAKQRQRSRPARLLSAARSSRSSCSRPVNITDLAAFHIRPNPPLGGTEPRHGHKGVQPCSLQPVLA